jgi:hypothetical protein
MPVGIVTLLGASLWLPPCIRAQGENPWPSRSRWWAHWWRRVLSPPLGGVEHRSVWSCCAFTSRHARILSRCSSAPARGVLGGLLSYTHDLVVSCPVLGVYWQDWRSTAGARGQAALSSDILVGLGWRCTANSLGDVVSPLVGCLGFVLLFFFFFIFDCFVRGSPHHFVSVWPCGFIYKAERKPVSRVDFEPSWAEMSI